MPCHERTHSNGAGGVSGAVLILNEALPQLTALPEGEGAH